MRLVLRDRAAETAAELTAAVIALCRRLICQEPGEHLTLAERVHRLVSKKLEDAALPGVRAAFRDDVHDATVAAAVFGFEPLSLEVELLNRFERELLQDAPDGVVVVVAAIDLIVDVAAIAAVNLRRVLRALGRVGMKPETDARHRRREICELTAVERQALDAPQIDDLSDRRTRRLDEWRGARDVDRFGQRRDLQIEVDRQGLRDCNVDVLLGDRGESHQLRRDIVEADRQRVETVDTSSVARLRSREAGRRVVRGDLCTGNRGAMLIEHSPGDVPGRLLREQGRAAQGTHDHADHRAKKTSSHLVLQQTTNFKDESLRCLGPPRHWICRRSRSTSERCGADEGSRSRRARASVTASARRPARAYAMARLKRASWRSGSAASADVSD